MAMVLPPQIAPGTLKKYRRSYRGFCHMLIGQGLPARDDFPGVDKPETVTALVASETAWLHGTPS